MGEKRIIEQVASNVVHNDDWFPKDSPTEGTSKISGDNLKAILGADGTLALEEIANAIAEEYNSSATYNKDDFVFYENKLYRCLANDTTGTWDGTKWEEFDLPTALITTAHNIETAEFTIGTYYSADDLVLKDGKLYQCVVFHNATEWKSQFWRSVTIDEMLGYLSDSIAPEHNQSTVYAVGDLVMHNKALWRCIQAGAGAFVNANWELVTVADLIAEAGKIDDVQVKTTGDYETVVENKIAKIDLSSVTAYGSVPNLPQAIATFKDGADAPMKSLKVAIEPVQDLHGYDSPWVGGAGKNKYEGSPLFDEYVDKNKWTLQAEKYNGHDVYKKSTAWGGMYKLTYLDVGTYTFSCMCKTSDSATVFIFLKIDNVTTAITDVTQISNTSSTSWAKISGTFNVTSAGTVAIRVERFNDNGDIYISEYQLESGSTATSYAPYSNICPITGYTEANVTRTGKNLYSHNGISIYDYAFSQQIAFSQMRNPIFMKSGQKYVLSLSENITLFRMRAFDKFQNLVTDASIVNALNQGSGTGLVFYANGNFFGYNGAGANSITVFQPTEDIWFDMTVQTTSPSQVMFEIGDTPTTYEPYTGSTYTIDLDGTRYGGTLDVVSGVLTVDRVTISGRVTSLSSNTYSNIVYGTIEKPNDSKNKGNTEVHNLISSMYPVSPIITGWDNANNIGKMFVGASYTQFWLGFPLGTTLQDAQTETNNNVLCYELATPLTIQLTPTAVKSLLGSNNVWADTGDINECVYRRDMSSTINDIIARIEALEG